MIFPLWPPQPLDMLLSDPIHLNHITFAGWDENYQKKKKKSSVFGFFIR